MQSMLMNIKAIAAFSKNYVTVQITFYFIILIKTVSWPGNNTNMFSSNKQEFRMTRSWENLNGSHSLVSHSFSQKHSETAATIDRVSGL